MQVTSCRSRGRSGSERGIGGNARAISRNRLRQRLRTLVREAAAVPGEICLSMPANFS
jgi:hypothetical protein